MLFFRCFFCLWLLLIFRWMLSLAESLSGLWNISSIRKHSSVYITNSLLAANCMCSWVSTFSTQRSPVHWAPLNGALNRDTHLYPPHNNSPVFLTTTTYVRRGGRIINGTRSGRTTPQDSALQFQTSVHTHPEWPSQEEPGSGSTASAPVSDVSAPACTNGAWPPLRPVSVAQNKPSTMSSSTVQSIDPPPHGLHGLTVLDDETTEWLLNTCSDI